MEGAHLLSTEKSLSLASLDTGLWDGGPQGRGEEERGGRCILTISLPPVSAGLVSGAT